MPTNSTRIDSLLEELRQNAAKLQHGDDRARDGIVRSCESMISEVERPSDTLVRFTWGYLPALMAMRTAIDLKIFHNLSSEVKSSIQLAAPTSADSVLVLRVLRTLSAAGVIRALSKDSFASTAFSVAMTQPDFEESFHFMIDTNSRAVMSTPTYLRDRGWQNPANPYESPLALDYALPTGEKELAFQIWPRLGVMGGLFATLRAWSFNQVHWADEQQGFYPFTERILNGASAENALLVDLGGGSGADLRNLLRLHPSSTRLILQEIPAVIEGLQSTELPPQIQLMSHDFFVSAFSRVLPANCFKTNPKIKQPQPVLGARTYFFHSIIHDWQVEQAKQILQTTAAAMVKGYSKLIIWDTVIPDTDCPLAMAGLDWYIMTFLNSKERTEIEWKALIESEDVQPQLRVTGLWFYSRNHQVSTLCGSSSVCCLMHMLTFLFD